MAPKGFKTITVSKALHARLERMRKAERRSGIPECIEYLLKFTIY